MAHILLDGHAMLLEEFYMLQRFSGRVQYDLCVEAVHHIDIEDPVYRRSVVLRRFQFE